MDTDLKVLFYKRLQSHFADFSRKIQQNQLFQIQERLAENIIKQTKTNQTFAKEIPELTIYEKNAKDLAATGKTYKNVLEEKIYTDGFRIFEEFLANLFTSIFTVFPNLLLIGSDKMKELSVPFEYIFTNPDIERTQTLIIENRVKSYLQGDNMLKILERFKTTFELEMNVLEPQKLDCQRISLLRNIITHNNSVVNEIYLKSITTFRILNDSYKLGESVLTNLETEINSQRIILQTIVQQIIKDLELENNLKKLEQRNQSLSL